MNPVYNETVNVMVEFLCLQATDVAARGIDIPEIDLIVQSQYR